jgi:hypothetical protein
MLSTDAVKFVDVVGTIDDGDFQAFKEKTDQNLSNRGRPSDKASNRYARQLWRPGAGCAGDR